MHDPGLVLGIRARKIGNVLSMLVTPTHRNLLLLLICLITNSAVLLLMTRILYFRMSHSQLDCRLWLQQLSCWRRLAPPHWQHLTPTVDISNGRINYSTVGTTPLWLFMYLCYVHPSWHLSAFFAMHLASIAVSATQVCIHALSSYYFVQPTSISLQSRYQNQMVQ